MRPLHPPPSVSINDASSPLLERLVSDLDHIVHLAAIGTSSGIIHIVNAFSGRIERDLQIHNSPVRFVILDFEMTVRALVKESR